MLQLVTTNEVMFGITLLSTIINVDSFKHSIFLSYESSSSIGFLFPTIIYVSTESRYILSYSIFVFCAELNVIAKSILSLSSEFNTLEDVIFIKFNSIFG